MSEGTQTDMDLARYEDQLRDTEGELEAAKQDAVDMTAERDVEVAKVERLQDAIDTLTRVASDVARGK